MTTTNLIKWIILVTFNIKNIVHLDKTVYVRHEEHFQVIYKLSFICIVPGGGKLLLLMMANIKFRPMDNRQKGI